MGLSGISPMSLVLIFLIVVCLFGTKKLRELGGDLGSAIRSFKEGLKEDPSQSSIEHPKTDREDKP